jgi:hypothetical protein
MYILRRSLSSPWSRPNHGLESSLIEVEGESIFVTCLSSMVEVDKKWTEAQDNNRLPTKIH